MNTHIKFVPADAAVCVRHVDALGRFLEKEAEDLREILTLFGDYEAVETVAALVGLCGAEKADVMAVGTALETVVRALEAIPFLLLEHVAMEGQGPRDLHAAVRWYGGRLSDLSDAFPG